MPIPPPFSLHATPPCVRRTAQPENLTYKASLLGFTPFGHDFILPVRDMQGSTHFS